MQACLHTVLYYRAYAETKRLLRLTRCPGTSLPSALQAEQAVQVDQAREFVVNFQDRRSGEMRLSIKVRPSNPASGFAIAPPPCLHNFADVAQASMDCH